MLVGYMRVSKADGSQVLDLQKDALLGAGVDPDHLYDFVVSSDSLNGTTRHCQRSIVESLVGHPMQYNDMPC